jgi:hypothetical protein
MGTRLCEVCRVEVDSQRLEGISDTRLCAEHAEDIKEFGGEFVMTAKQQATSKAGSLKLNYGTVETTRKRNAGAIDKLRDKYRLENQ